MRPINALVFVRPYVAREEISPAGLILPAHATMSQDGTGPALLHESGNPLYANQGEVVALDPTIVDPPVQVGEWVVFSPFAGEVVTLGRDENLIALPVDRLLAVVDL